MTSAEARLVPDTGPAPGQQSQTQIEFRQDTYSLIQTDTTEIVANPVMTTIRITCTVH